METNDPQPYEPLGDEALEARIVAWVHGEASDTEQLELQSLCAARPELEAFRRRMVELHALLKDEAKPLNVAEWRLPAEKRAVVTALFEVDELAAERRIQAMGRARITALAACIGMVGVAVFLLKPEWHERVEIDSTVAADFLPASPHAKQAPAPRKLPAARGMVLDSLAPGAATADKFSDGNTWSAEGMGREEVAEMEKAGTGTLTLSGKSASLSKEGDSMVLKPATETPARQTAKGQREVDDLMTRAGSDAYFDADTPVTGGRARSDVAKESLALRLEQGRQSFGYEVADESAKASGAPEDASVTYGARGAVAQQNGLPAKKLEDGRRGNAQEAREDASMPPRENKFAETSSPGAYQAGEKSGGLGGAGNGRAAGMSRGKHLAANEKNGKATRDESGAQDGATFKGDLGAVASGESKDRLAVRDEKTSERKSDAPMNGPAGQITEGLRSGDAGIALGNEAKPLERSLAPAIPGAPPVVGRLFQSHQDGDAKNSMDREGQKVPAPEVTMYDAFAPADPTPPAPSATPVAGKPEPQAPAPKVQARVPVKDMDEVTAAADPFSTFSLHVSDASFVAAKAAIDRGQRPEAEGIRPEEFYNAFDYGDPAPAKGEAVACRIEQTAHPVLSQRNLVRVAMRTGASGRAASQPLHLTVLLDNSGSMEREDRKEGLIRAMQQLASLLGPNDRVTLAGFSRTPRLMAESVSGDRAKELVAMVAQTPSEGGTNMEEAIRVGGQLALRQKKAGAQNRIVLLTDGAANLGNAKPEALAQQIAALRQQGIAFDAAGVGAGDANDQLLEQLTRNGDGRYYLIRGPEDADANFARKLAGAFRPAAENVKVQVHFNPDRVSRYKLIGFEKHRLNTEDFRNDKVDAAELAAEEAGVAIYQVETLPEGKGELGEVSVRFRDAARGEMVERTWTMTYDPRTPSFDRATPSMQLATFAMLTAEKLRGGPLGEAIDFSQLTPQLAQVRSHYAASSRVRDLATMIQQLR